VCRIGWFILDTGTHEISAALEHPDDELDLTGWLVCILATGEHVKPGPSGGVITKDDLLARDCLLDNMKMAMEGSGGETNLWFDVFGTDEVVHAVFPTPQQGVL
jgi:hypothetical protein